MIMGFFFFPRHDSTEMDHSENEDITLKRADGPDKVLKPRSRKNADKSMSPSLVYIHWLRAPENTPFSLESLHFCGSPVLNMSSDMNINVSSDPDHLVYFNN